MTSPSLNIAVIVGSTNPVKLRAAERTLGSLYSARITAIPFKSDPGIIAWKSPLAIGQPFGAEQTAFGAINRTYDCWKKMHTELAHSYDRIYALSFENGLVAPKELGEVGTKWFDICFTTLFDGRQFVVTRSNYVKTNFEPLDSKKGDQFDEAVSAYEREIMPLIRDGVDLYEKWTQASGNKRSRDDYQVECGIKAFNHLHNLNRAEELMEECIRLGFPASVGSRYNTTNWMRDLAYMGPVYLKKGALNYLEAINGFREEQISTPIHRNDGYQSVNCFGSLPIVYVRSDNEKKFLLQRLEGTDEEPTWQRRLWNFCQLNCPERLSQFPGAEQSEKGYARPCLEGYTADQLRQYYRDLESFSNHFLSEFLKVPKPSFTLTSYLNGTLRILTAGTRDSEIHYLRSLFLVIRHDPTLQQSVLADFNESMAKALFYLYANVIDAQDGLPRGIDSRDIFADFLYDAKALSNALFLYEVLKAFIENAEALKDTSFIPTLSEAIKNNFCEVEEAPIFLRELVCKDLSEIFIKEAERLRSSIQNSFLFCENEFRPRDFIPGPRASIGLDHPILPMPKHLFDIIRTDNPTFVDGVKPDPQSLAYAVLNGLIDSQHYERVIAIFDEADSKIGVQVFVPISGRSEEEENWLKKVKGYVVWPHISWTVVRALLKMGVPHKAEEQINKLMEHCAHHEWVAVDPNTQEVYRGGDPAQGWSASSMLMAMADLKEYYETVGARENS